MLPLLPRRTTLCGWILLILLCSTADADDAPRYLLDEPLDDNRVFGVGFRVDVNGTLSTLGADNTPKPLELAVSAALSYRERRVVGPGRDAEALRTVRDYEVSTSEITVGGQKSPSLHLPENLKLTVAQGRAYGVEIYSLAGPMTAAEMDLVRVPCDSLLLPRLLPSREVAVGESWTPEAWVYQALTSLDAASSSKCTCKLDSVDGDVAQISVEGEIEGAIDGSATKVLLKGTLTYDLTQKAIVAWDLEQSEQRSIGVVSPGLDVKARVRAKRGVAQVVGRLGDSKLVDQASGELPQSSSLVRFDSPWNLTLLHARDWHLFHQNAQVAIFRLLDQGAFVAQCNIAPIPPAKPGEQTSEMAFEADIRSSLGDRLKSLDPPTRLESKGGRIVSRAVARGADEERPITWTYYFCSDPSGRQVSLLFSCDTGLVEKLGTRDRELVDSLKFTPAPSPVVKPD